MSSASSEDPDQERGALLEAFRRQLLAYFGEEPTILISADEPVRWPDDERELSLVEAVGWGMGVRHAAVYMPHPQEASFTAVARFQCEAPPIPMESVLLRRLLAHGHLIRNALSLDGLSPEEADTLVGQLDFMGAAVVAPGIVNDHVVSLVMVGPSLIRRPYTDVDLMRLSLYALSCWRSLNRRQYGLTQSKPIWERIEAGHRQAMDKLLELWRNLKPAHPPRLVILDESALLVRVLAEYFGLLGFATVGCRTQAEACAAIQAVPPQFLLVDLSLNRKLPMDVLTCARREAPQAALIGLTTGFGEVRERAVAIEYGFRCVLWKPMSMSELTSIVLETALEHSLHESRDPFP
jgi:ActR/RegA family two-component response regulator